MPQEKLLPRGKQLESLVKSVGYGCRNLRFFFVNPTLESREMAPLQQVGEVKLGALFIPTHNN